MIVQEPTLGTVQSLMTDVENILSDLYDRAVEKRDVIGRHNVGAILDKAEGIKRLVRDELARLDRALEGRD